MLGQNSVYKSASLSTKVCLVHCIFKHLNANYYRFASCVQPLLPWNDPNCDYRIWYERFGGDYAPWYYFLQQGLLSMDEIGCVDYSLNQTDCNSTGGEWHTQATTEAECHAHGYACQEQVYIDEHYTTWLTPKSTVQCSEVNGTVVPFFSWKKVSGISQGECWQSPTLGDLDSRQVPRLIVAKRVVDLGS